MKKIIASLVIFAAFSHVFADSSTYYDENEHRYERIDSRMTWSDAKEYCEDSDGYLATITSRDENDFIYDELARDESSNIWLGGTDESREGSWRWVTDEEWDYENWSSGRPNDRNDGEDYLTFNSNHSRRWDDNGLPHSDSRKKFICEYNETKRSEDCDATYRNGRLTIIIDICSE